MQEDSPSPVRTDLSSPSEPAAPEATSGPVKEEGRTRRRKYGVTRHNTGQRLAILRAIDASAKPLPEACKENQITIATYYRWRKLVDEMSAPTEGVLAQPGPHGANPPCAAPLATDAHAPLMPPPAGTQKGQLDSMKWEFQCLRDTVVQLSIDNTNLRRHNAALMDALVLLRSQQQGAPAGGDAPGT